MSPSAVALVCVEFSRLLVGTSIALPVTMSDVDISTTATPSTAIVRRDGSPPSVGLAIAKQELVLQYTKPAKRVEVDFFAGSSAELNLKVTDANGAQLDARSFSRPGTYVFVSSGGAIRSIRATSNNEAIVERVCFGGK